MLKGATRIFLWLLVLCNGLSAPFSQSAISAINHGINTTFDCNAWGGSPCACFMSAASGKCGNATAHYSNATCNGGDDSAALADWLSYGHSLWPAQVVLNVPAGCTEGAFGGDGNSSFSADVTIHCAGFGAQPITTVNAVVWAYDTTFDSLWFGGLGFHGAQNEQPFAGCGSGPTNTSPLIQAANSGDNFVTLITPSDITGNISVGDEIAITALGTQKFGSPPNPQIFEYKTITVIDVVSGKLTLDSKLKFSYKTTYPNLGGTTPFFGGPATIYLMEKTHSTNSRYFGMTISGVGQTNIIGKNITLSDVTWSNPSANGPNPTQSGTIQIIRGHYPASEVDKAIDTLSVSNGVIGNTDFQSASINNFTMQGTTITGSLVGTPTNATIVNSKINIMRVGPTCCGQASSLALNNVTLTIAQNNYHKTQISLYSFSGGTLTIPKANFDPGVFIPGHKYFAGPGDGSNTCSPANTFTALDVQDAGSNVNILTDLASISFGNTCSAGTAPPTFFGSYNTMSLTQVNSAAAQALLLALPEMLPP